jgi:hypothetical protein
MDSDDAFRSIAAQMGVIGVPGSVKMSVYNVEATETKAQSGDITVNATYTLQWSGNNGSSGWVTQSLTAAYTKSGGRGHLTKVAISPTLQFDEYAYFGESGTSEADANKVAADLKAGSSWIPGIDVKVSSWKQDTKTTPTITAVPGHLTKWVKTVTPAVNGSKTTWDVEVAGSKVSYSWISAASSVTAKPTGAQIQQGTITDAEAVAGAAAVQKSLAAAARSGDLTTFNSLVTGPKVDAAGLAHMNTWAFGSGTGTATEGSSGPEVSVSGDHGTLTYVLGSDGKWTIDSTRSSLAEAWRPGDGTVYRYEAGVCFGSECEDLANFCVSHVGVSLTGVTYYTNATAEAAFHFTSTNPECALGDLISTVVVSWPGGSDTIHPQVAGTNDSSSNDAVVPLPSGVTADKHPVQLEITGWNYYDPMDDPMYFSTI